MKKLLTLNVRNYDKSFEKIRKILDVKPKNFWEDNLIDQDNSNLEKVFNDLTPLKVIIPAIKGKESLKNLIKDSVVNHFKISDVIIEDFIGYIVVENRVEVVNKVKVAAITKIENFEKIEIAVNFINVLVEKIKSLVLIDLKDFKINDS